MVLHLSWMVWSVFLIEVFLAVSLNFGLLTRMGGILAADGRITCCWGCGTCRRAILPPVPVKAR